MYTNHNKKINTKKILSNILEEGIEEREVRPAKNYFNSTSIFWTTYVIIFLGYLILFIGIHK